MPQCPCLQIFCLVAAIISTSGPARINAAEAWIPAFAHEDVDFARSTIGGKGGSAALTEEAFAGLFLPTASRVERPEIKAAEGWQVTLQFRRPIALGTSLLGAGGAESSHFVAKILRPKVETAAEEARPDDWRELASVQTLEAGTETRGLRLTAKREYHGRITWLLGRAQLTDLTPEAVGSGEQAPFGSHPNAVPLGKRWINSDKDPRPGAPKQLQRGPISEATPSWYLLSWDQAQTLHALWLSCNADDFRLLAYRGREGLNPALAPADAWARVDFKSLHESRGHGDRLHQRLLTFSPLTTTAVKLEITNCNRGAVAVIERFAALSLAAPADDRSAAPIGTLIRYQQPFDGQTAMVITDTAGNTTRNLIAQVERKQGPRTEHWDLKDHNGMTVAPGKYRWKAITSPPLGLNYQMSVYPNAAQFFPDRTPWLTGESGANGWLADHASITSGAVSGDRVYFGAPGVEAGVCLIECDLTGKKLWGKHSFAPFVGVRRMAGDDRSVYIIERDSLHRLDRQSHQVERLVSLSSADRKGEVTGLAAHGGQVVAALDAPVPWLENAARADVVDLEHCLPKFAEKIPDPLGTRRVQPNPRLDFLRLLRLAGAPAGQGQVAPDKRESTFPITIDSTGEGKYQYVVVAFKEPMPLGSLVLPNVGPEYIVDVSVLKPSAQYPPDPRRDEDWQTGAETPLPGWTCVPLPPRALTRGIRLRVRRAQDAGSEDLIDDVLAERKPKPKSIDEFDIDKPGGGFPPKAEAKATSAGWFARFEGLKLLRRRFRDITPQAEVRVNSGVVNKRGEWDAQRKSALSVQDPGIYVLQWPQAIQVAGLAIKEIDGAVTEIDVWDDGPNQAEIPLSGSTGWRHVATYEQARRDSYEPAFERNDAARYLDGYVSLGGEVRTKAIRLRVVSQWADNGERGTSSLRIDQGGRSLDPRRCRIAGVAALQYLGEETPLDTLAYQRLEVRDGRTGKLLRELPMKTEAGDAAAVPSSLAFDSDGALFGIQNGKVVQIDLASGVTQPKLAAVDGKQTVAHRLAIGPDGSFQVFVLPERVIRVFDRSGKPIRTLGRPGGQTPGPWDPEKFAQVETLLVDGQGQTWVVESQDVPRRIVQYAADGKFVREFYGNTHYGGGGVLDPADKSRVIYHQVEFAVDWETGRSRIKNLLAEWMPENCIPMRYGATTYLVRNPLSHNPVQNAAVIYRYDERQGTARLTTAFGEANAFDELKTPEILSRLADGKVPKDYTFLWSDRNDDGRVEAGEIHFELKAAGEGPLRLGRFNDKLRCWAGKHYYQPKADVAGERLEFEKIAAPPSVEARYELSDGRLLMFQAPRETPAGESDGDAQETRGMDREGRITWRYPTSYAGVSGLFLPPWSPGYVTNEFGVIGHGTTHAGDLGEFIVMHGNNGMWKIWTADGLLAGQILRHKFDPQSIVDSSRATVQRNQSFADLTAGQEHFHGYFTQTADGRAYIVHGFNYLGLWEVTGLDRFQRLSGELDVTPEDIRRVRLQQEELARREAKSLAKVLECLPVKGEEIAEAARLEDTRFCIGYDNEHLYLRWNVSGMGKLENSGVDFHRYFKTGACLDFQLGVNDGDPARKMPIDGDLRLLFTVAEGRPQAVLYQPSAPGAAPKDAWETRTDAGGTTRFDRVVKLASAKLDFQPDAKQPQRYSFTAIIPLRDLGWKPRDGQVLRCDWGVLTSDDGHTVKRRLYWSNSLATGTTDEAWEARLDPHLWGHLAVVSKSRADRQLDFSTPEGARKPAAGSDILDDILNKK